MILHSTLPRLLQITLLPLLAGLALAACTVEEHDPLRLAINPWPGYGYFAIARQEGFIDPAGAFELHIIDTASLGDSKRILERGQADLIGGTLAELADLNAHGRRTARAVLVLNRSQGEDMIVAGPNVPVLAALQGKRVALESGSANMLVLAAAADQAGIDTASITRVQMPQVEMPAALASRRIDAAITYPPISQALLDQTGSHRLFDTRDAPNAVIDVLIASRDIIESRPGDLAKLVRAHQAALDWAREHPEEALQRLAQNIGQSTAAVSATLAGIEMVPLNEQTSMWQDGGPLFHSLKVATGFVAQQQEPVATSDLEARDQLDDSFVKAASAP